MTDLFVNRKAITVLLLLIISSVGFYIRYDNLNHWLENKYKYFSPTDNTPVTLSVDSYYYLDIAQDILQGKIKKFDQQRQAPNSFEKPVTLPLLSLTLALISKITGKPLEWIAILLPPFLAVILAIPVFFLSLLLFRTSCYKANENTPASAIISGLVAALFALISPAFVERSSVGWSDTDVLNVTLLCSLTLVALRAAVSKNTRELVFSLTGFTLLTGFFLLWWDMATAPVVAFSLGYFFLAGLLSIHLQRSNGKVFVLFLIIICFLLLAVQGGSFFMLPEQLLQMIKYSISNDAAGMQFLHAGQLVSEQQDVSFALMARKVAGNEWICSLSLLGVSLLALITRKYFLFLIPWIILLFLATRSHRLMIFPSVLSGLGMGTIVFLACTYLKKLNFVRLLPVLTAVLITAWFPFTEAQSYFSKAPKRSPLLFDSFKQIAKKVPDEAIIWASWGHGHPLVFYTKAKTIGDGIYHPPELVFSQYVPFATNNFRMAANWITFYSTHGIDGLKQANELLTGNSDDWAQGIPALQELLGKGITENRRILLGRYTFSPQATEEFLSFIYPHPPLPIYFLLDYVAYGEQWFPWGSMTFTEAGKNNPYTMIPIFSFSQSGSRFQGKSTLGDVSFDLLKGVGKVGSGGVQLKQLRADNGKDSFAHSYNTFPWAPSLLLNQSLSITYGALVDDKILDTVFTRMFFLKDYDETYFQPFFDASPLILVYQVKGDVYDKGNE